MASNYFYPIHDGWSDSEIATVINFLNAVEEAYEGGVDRQKVLNRYKAFKQIVNSKSEEKTVGREFEKSSGYSLYQVLKTAQTSHDKKIKMLKEGHKRDNY